MSENIPHDTKGADPTEDMPENESKEMKAQDHDIFLIKGIKSEVTRKKGSDKESTPPSPGPKG